MRIGIDATFRMHGGGMLHLRQLLRAWRNDGVDQSNELVLYTRTGNLASLHLPDELRLDIHDFEFSSFWKHRLLWQQTVLSRLAEKDKLDVLFCPGGISPLRRSIPVVVALRNAAPFCDGVTPKTVGLSPYLMFQALGKMMRRSASTASRVIFISRYFKDLFEQQYDLPPERSQVIYHGRDGLSSDRMLNFDHRQLRLDLPYVLSLSHLYRYKNIPALIRGYGLARKQMERSGLRLALIGKPKTESYHKQLQKLIRELGLENQVLLPGPVGHHNIGSLLRDCEFFVFQSTCENCPNTLIEALAEGVPIASSNAGVMPEIAGKGAIYFDPFDAGDIARALSRMAENRQLRASLRAKALEEATKFPTWSQVGQLTLDCLERAAGVPQPELIQPTSVRE